MGYTTLGKNTMLNALAAVATHAGLFDAAAAIAAVTGSNATDTFTKNAHGLANGDLIMLSGLNGGSAIANQRPYYIVASAANTFQLALTPGGAAVDLGSDVIDVTVTKYVEIAGGAPAYARKAVTWNAAAAGTLDDSTAPAPAFDVPAGATVDAAGLFTAAAAGTLLVLDPVTPEPFAAQGVYTLDDADLDLNQS